MFIQYMSPNSPYETFFSVYVNHQAVLSMVDVDHPAVFSVEVDHPAVLSLVDVNHPAVFTAPGELFHQSSFYLWNTGLVTVFSQQSV